MDLREVSRNWKYRRKCGGERNRVNSCLDMGLLKQGCLSIPGQVASCKSYVGINRKFIISF